MPNSLLRWKLHGGAAIFLGDGWIFQIPVVYTNCESNMAMLEYVSVQTFATWYVTKNVSSHHTFWSVKQQPHDCCRNHSSFKWASFPNCAASPHVPTSTAFAWLAETYVFSWYMGHYGHASAKPEKGWTNNQYFALLNRGKWRHKDHKKQGSSSASSSKTVIKTVSKVSGKTFYTGTKALKETQCLAC